ncbi:MAG: homoserine O-acetyltransferase [Planctomycetes bacterium]|nr:homoserine O-acetyltransferase [Planctomycetota bacterium]
MEPDMTADSKAYDPPESANSVGYTVAENLRIATAEDPLVLDSGGKLGPVDVEYETYGKLSPNKDNAVLICHALSGDAHVAGWEKDPETTGRLWRKRKPGWWDPVIGPGKAIDTDKYFVICANNLGSCYGTTSPSSLNPATGKEYGLAFPAVTIHDWVVMQSRLLRHLGIDCLHAVIGGSLGGQQALEWALCCPQCVRKSIVLAASSRLSAQGLAFNAVGRTAIMNDPNFNNGDYYHTTPPRDGLAAARMLAHITYLSDEAMHEKFGRRLRNKVKPDFGFDIEFEVESYLDYQGRSFVERFDANSYLYITRAMDYYDAAEKWGGGDLVAACSRIQSEVMVVSFSSDWLYPPQECMELALAISRNSKPVNYINVPSHYGHDAFLVETEAVGRLMQSFLKST